MTTNDVEFNTHELCSLPQEVFCKYSDAVVSIRAEFVLVNTDPALVPTILTPSEVAAAPLGSGTRRDVILTTNGFFIKEHFIVTSAQGLLMPPSYSSVVQRYPFTTVDPRPTGVTMYNTMVRPSRILVTVRNVNGNGKDYIYLATLIGVDGAGDIAVLKICNQRTGWNYKVPCVKRCHPYFSWGKSKDVCVGDSALVIGSPRYTVSGRTSRENQLQLVETNVMNNQFVLESGWALQELVTVNGANLVSYKSGAPILNCNGRIIGMLAVSQDPLAAGPSENFITRSVKTILRGRKNHKAKDFLECVNDPIAKYLRVLKSYAGIAYETFDGVDYDYTATYSTAVGEIAFAGQPRIRLDATGNFLTSPDCKQVKGIRVIGVAGVTGAFFAASSLYNAAPFPNTGTVDPGGYTGITGGYDLLPNSPFAASLLPGDLVIKFGKCKLESGFAPAKVTWRTKPGRSIKLKYVRGGNLLNATVPNSSTENYNNDPVTLTGTLSTYPALLDYPWYAYNIFPNPSAFGFAYPANQATNGLPEYTSVLNRGVFRVAF